MVAALPASVKPEARYPAVDIRSHLLSSAAIGSTDWPQRKWPVRRSRVRAHGTAPFTATIAATRH
jgi:hypothetical protein